MSNDLIDIHIVTRCAGCVDHYGPVFALQHSLSDEPCDTRNILSPQDAIN